MLAVLSALGAPLERPADIADALRERRDELARRVLEPVTVAWEGESATIALGQSAGRGSERIECRLELEDGTARTWVADPSSLAPSRERAPSQDGAIELVLPEGLPSGYHRIEVELGERSASATVLSAPSRVANTLSPGAWGVFAPLHALHRASGWGVGDLADLGELQGRVRELGGSLVGTLPLFAAFLRDPTEPSPYSPVSRLFWNELFVDVEAVPEVRSDPRAVEIIGSTAFRRGLERLRAGELVDPAAVMKHKRELLEAAARALRSSPSERRDAFDRFCVERPRVHDYARFRAAGERWGVDWRRWPMPSRDGRLSDADVDVEAAAYHRYVQWIAEVQIAALSSPGPGCLYLDLPVGVHPDGYDVWRERATFAPGVSAGAPPDDLFAGGQDWGFPPPHPERIREQGYRYLIECLRHAMRHAAALRVDHVMGLHRLYWVPHGSPAGAGVYVRYRPDEWYAILSIESHRAGATVVGEDLGTVPAPVRTSMRRRGLLRSSVLEMEVDPDRSPPIRSPRGSLASLNTHDLPPFAAFWRGLDIDRRVALGLTTDAEAEAERRRRERVRDALTGYLRTAGFLEPGASGGGAVLSACLSYLAASPAEAVVVGLEDLWGETRAQNQPGVTNPGNWRRRAAYPLDSAWELPEVSERLRSVAALRRGGSVGRSVATEGTAEAAGVRT